MKQTIDNIWLIIGVIVLVVFGAIGELARAVHETTSIPWAWSIIIGCSLSFVLVLGIAALIRFVYRAGSHVIRSYASSHIEKDGTDEDIVIPALPDEDAK